MFCNYLVFGANEEAGMKTHHMFTRGSCIVGAPHELHILQLMHIPRIPLYPRFFSSNIKIWLSM